MSHEIDRKTFFEFVERMDRLHERQRQVNAELGKLFDDAAEAGIYVAALKNASACRRGLRDRDDIFGIYQTLVQYLRPHKTNVRRTGLPAFVTRAA